MFSFYALRKLNYTWLTNKAVFLHAIVSNRDAKIAALEKTSAESERLMAEARNEKIRHMDELHSAQKKVADLEGRLVNIKLYYL